MDHPDLNPKSRGQSVEVPLCHGGLDWTTQAIGQQHTSPLRAGCEARRREIVVIFVVVMAWRAMPLRLLKLMAGLGRAVGGGTPAKSDPAVYWTGLLEQ